MTGHDEDECEATIGSLNYQLDQVTARQKRTADYAQHWRREAERSEKAANAYRDALDVQQSQRLLRELEDYRRRFVVLTEALAKAEAAL